MAAQATIHRKKFADGRYSAMDVHRALAWGGRRCSGCGVGAPTIKITSFMPVSDYVKRYPEKAAARAALNGGRLLTTGRSIKYGPMVRLGEQLACAACQAAAERAAARLPSNVLVEIDRGPASDRTIL